MVQWVGNRIQMRIVDFGNARRKNVVGFEDDVRQITRMFLGLYIGVEFKSILDFQKNWVSKINEASIE